MENKRLKEAEESARLKIEQEKKEIEQLRIIEEQKAENLRKEKELLETKLKQNEDMKIENEKLEL